MNYKLKPITESVVVHTPTEAEAKELLEILHENGWKWVSMDSLIDTLNRKYYRFDTCYSLRLNTVQFGSKDYYEKQGNTILTLSQFKEKYCEEFSKGDKVIYAGEESSDYKGDKFEIDGEIFYNDYFKCLMASSIYNGIIYLGNVPLSDLEPYTEPTEKKPKFKVGDKVKIKDSYYKEELHGSIGIVRREASPFSFYVEIDNTIYQVGLNDLKPYTEPTEELKEDNFIKTKNMETKELNLKEILKDCPKGTVFYSLLEGSVIFEGINPREREFGEKPIMCNEEYYCADGAYQDKPNAACCLWPSRALFEQYPLDPYTAWQKWLEEQKKWGLQISFIGDDGWSGVETHLTFKSEEEYQMAVKEIKSVIGKYSKK